jgi:hypothetical protein
MKIKQMLRLARTLTLLIVSAIATTHLSFAKPTPPPPDAVWDVRYACLYGELEGAIVSAKDRIEMCDRLGELERKALDIGFCWNQVKGQYVLCE